MALRFWPRSLIARILIVELGAILIAALILPALMVWQLHAQVDRYEVQTLTKQGREIGRGLAIEHRRIIVRLRHDLAPSYTSPYDGRALRSSMPRAG